MSEKLVIKEGCISSWRSLIMSSTVQKMCNEDWGCFYCLKRCRPARSPLHTQTLILWWPCVTHTHTQTQTHETMMHTTLLYPSAVKIRKHMTHKRQGMGVKDAYTYRRSGGYVSSSSTLFWCLSCFCCIATNVMSVWLFHHIGFCRGCQLQSDYKILARWRIVVQDCMTVVCVCLCACVHACVCARVCARMCVLRVFVCMCACVCAFVSYASNYENMCI